MHSALTVVTPNANVALTTLDRTKGELGISGGGYDALLTSKIREASSDIEAHIGRVLRRETVSETFWGANRAVDTLILNRWPVASIVSVSVDGSDLDAGDYRLVADAGLLYRLDGGGYASRWAIGREAVITYVAGYAMPAEAEPDLPAVLEAAAVELVNSYWVSRGRDPLVREEDVPGVGRTVYWVGAVGAAGALPPGVESKIAPFRRIVIG